MILGRVHLLLRYGIERLWVLMYTRRDGISFELLLSNYILFRRKQMRIFLLKWSEAKNLFFGYEPIYNLSFLRLFVKIYSIFPLFATSVFIELFFLIVMWINYHFLPMSITICDVREWILWNKKEKYRDHHCISIFLLYPIPSSCSEILKLNVPV